MLKPPLALLVARQLGPVAAGQLAPRRPRDGSLMRFATAVVRFLPVARQLAILIPMIGPAAAGALNPAFEAAVERDAAVRALVARRVEITAGLNAASYLIPAPPSFTAGFLTDWGLRNTGFREYEAELSAPMWLPGERGATRVSIEAASSKLEANIAVARLRVASAVRDVYWKVEVARQTLALAERKRGTARALVEDTARQVSAGRVARLDLHLAEADLQEAEAAVTGRSAELNATRVSFHALTGIEPPAAIAEPEAAEDFPTDHPWLRALRWEVEHAKAEYRLARLSVRDAPEIALIARAERDDFEERLNMSLGVQVTIPFASEARNMPKRAAAVAQHSAALAELSAAKREIQAAVQRAEIALDSAERQFAALDRRIAELESVLALTERAYRVGESPIVEVIRARAAVFKAEDARLVAHIAAERARSDINQALGIEP